MRLNPRVSIVLAVTLAAVAAADLTLLVHLLSTSAPACAGSTEDAALARNASAFQRAGVGFLASLVGTVFAVDAGVRAPRVAIRRGFLLVSLALGALVVFFGLIAVLASEPCYT